MTKDQSRDFIFQLSLAELDCAVGEEILDDPPFPSKAYSVVIAESWRVLLVVRAWNDLGRTAVFEEVLIDSILRRHITNYRPGHGMLRAIAVMMHMEPEDICRAALAAVRTPESGEQMLRLE